MRINKLLSSLGICSRKEAARYIEDGRVKVNGILSIPGQWVEESDEILIESFMQGREVACGLVKTNTRKIIFPLTEIISKNEFFDFEAKYTPGKSDEITPAALPEKLTDEIRNLSSRIADLLGCRGIVRVDFIITGDKPLFLEINTVPGMTEESIIPKQAAAAGIPLEDLYSMVIEDLFV